MTVDETLARLMAGLDQDEAIARTAAKRDGEQWSITHIPHEGITVWAKDDDDLPGYTDEQTEHMQHHDPARVLRYTDVMREIIKLCDPYGGARYPDFEGGYATALDDVIELFARIYQEEQ